MAGRIAFGIALVSVLLPASMQAQKVPSHASADSRHFSPWSATSISQFGAATFRTLPKSALPRPN